MFEGCAVTEARLTFGAERLKVYVPAAFDTEMRVELVAGLLDAGCEVTGVSGEELSTVWRNRVLTSAADLRRELGEGGSLREAADAELNAAIECNVCVLLPGGIDSLLGAGLASGMGARLVVVLPDQVVGNWALLYRAADDLVDSVDAALDAVLQEREALCAA